MCDNKDIIKKSIIALDDDDDFQEEEIDATAGETEHIEHLTPEELVKYEKDEDFFGVEMQPYLDLLDSDMGLRIMEVDISKDKNELTYDSIKTLKFPGYKRNTYRTTFPVKRESNFILPTFMFDKEKVKKGKGEIENEYIQHNLKILEKYVFCSVAEQFQSELNSILSAYALPQCIMKTIFQNKGITVDVFKRKTKLSHTVHAKIMKEAEFSFKLTTLINICWSLKIEYPVAKRLIEAYGYNLDGTTKNLLAYKYVLKYMLHFKLETVEAFLNINKVPLFK